MLESIILLSKILQIGDVALTMGKEIGRLIHKAANNQPYTNEETATIDKLVEDNHAAIQAM